MSLRLFSFLTGVPAPSKVKHYLVKGSFASQTEMAPPKFLIIDGTGDDPNGKGVYLYRFEENGDCLNDTWHMNIDDAKAQAAYEYENFVHGWHEIPDEVNDVGEYGAGRIKELTNGLKD